MIFKASLLIQITNINQLGTLDQVLEEKAIVKALVNKSSFKIRDLDETLTKEKVITALCRMLDSSELGKTYKLRERSTRFLGR